MNCRICNQRYYQLFSEEICPECVNAIKDGIRAHSPSQWPQENELCMSREGLQDEVRRLRKMEDMLFELFAHCNELAKRRERPQSKECDDTDL